MALVEINWNPSRRELKQFGLLWVVFFGLIGAYQFGRDCPSLIDISQDDAKFLMVLTARLHVGDHCIRGAFRKRRHSCVRDKNLLLRDGKAFEALSLGREQSHGFFSASSMSFQNSLALPSCSSSSSIGMLER